MSNTTPPDRAILHRLALVAAKLERLRTDGSADTGKYDYRFLSLPSLLAAIKQALLDEQLALLQPVAMQENEMMRVDTMIICLETGENIIFPGVGWAMPKDPQVTGSWITYSRRYNLSSLFALEVVDDDGGTAHRAAARPTSRTTEEIAIRELLGTLTNDQRSTFQARFLEEFGCGLKDLAESKHADAWAFTQQLVAELEPVTE